MNLFAAPFRIVFTLGVLLKCIPLHAAPDLDVPEGIRVRAGYKLTVAESTIKTPRFMKLAPDGTLFVSVPNDGKIYALRDTDGDGYYEKKTTFASPGPSTHGLFWHDGWLWWTQSSEIGKSRDTNNDGEADETVSVLGREQLTEGGGHWWRSIVIHKNRLYTSIGDSGNITPDDGKRQKIWSYSLDGKDEKLFCSGLRNTEKLVIRPGTDEIWGVDHDSDWFGKELEDQVDKGQPITDELPPCEMNHYKQDGFYGHPFLVGNRIPRLEYLDREDLVELAAKTIIPEWCCGPHWAPNAMEFYTGEKFPGTKGDAFVAYHGSWNRTKPAGYQVTRVLFEEGHPYGEQPYVRFRTEEGKVLGRPVDCAIAKDGSLLITDDGRSRIYRLSYEGK